MKVNEIKLAYIDDEDDAIYGIFKEIKDRISERNKDEFIIKIEFINLKNETSQESFWEKLQEHHFHGIILDYKLVDSKIYESADLIWKKIKLYNPLFPLTIYTSHPDEITLSKEAESIFSKGVETQIEEMLDYLLKQIKHSIETIEALKRVNSELKNDQNISLSVMKNEEKIENQFALINHSDINEEEELKFKELIKNAFNIINNYTERKDN
ncbi:hypothetical protein J3256_002843 [Listeria monocytogenes]|uniref:hypothetical protein n=1 Tax=Listeria monocytogenes TaxID=1639 RepID=UPI000E73AE11|nr:hypothetical protein [Listeria monocytogenes]EAC5847196.1 hypothetical protein [Listeria monocytogenes]EAF1400510.1 hypothetical protein [Listeria monocytogenes]EAG1208662.1 hypothetical protein [Listeria monocytogenes]ECR7132573.1 hypothetical protein [Listeria monocytogenes]EHG1755378.1 hypothetical protein [Listeria monocytogenes]